jgi:hypothetical protein
VKRREIEKDWRRGMLARRRGIHIGWSRKVWRRVRKSLRGVLIESYV